MASERDYPTDVELLKIRNWPLHDEMGWFDFVKSIWWMSDWGFRKRKNQINLSTAGWSGNESIIAAMQENSILWSMTWRESRVGGHYTFRIHEKAKQERKKGDHHE